MSQLALLASDVRAKADAADKAKRALCRCGHEVSHHDAKGKCTYGKGTRFGGCSCKRRAARGRLVVVQPPELEAPANSLVLMRPDTKRPKTMGWALVFKSSAVLYLEQLRTKSLNAMMGAPFRRFTDGTPSLSLTRQSFAIQAADVKKKRGWTTAAIQQSVAKVASIWSAINRLTKVVITRVSSGKLDDDNLAGALKAIRDGVADGLGLNDATFSIEGRDPNGIALFYRQTRPGKRKVRGVRIELFWEDR